MIQNDKIFCPLHSISQEPYIIWLSFLVHICKMIMSSDFFFHFFKILIFWVHRGVKGQKTVQNNKKFSVTLHLSGTIHFLSFMLQICKMIISPGIFFNFNIWFSGLSGGRKGKKWPKMTNVAPYISGTIYDMRKKMGKKMAQNDKTFGLSDSLSQELYIDCDFWYTV